MNRYEYDSYTFILCYTIKMKNMINKEPKNVTLKVGDKASILSVKYRDDILEPGVNDIIHHIDRGIVKDFILVQGNDNRYFLNAIKLDCSTKFESKVVEIPVSNIYDINDIDYVYENDDPKEIKAMFEYINKEEKPEEVISSTTLTGVKEIK